MTGSMSIVSIATSGMAAASLRLDVSASNVANISTTGPLPDSNSATAGGSPSAYTPLQVDQTATADGGTTATVKPVSPAYVATPDPTASYADQNGLVAAPNVELSNEIVQQMVARYTFAMNAQVATTGSQLTKALLDTMI
jgi:flagellar basal-body rod protein FlgC